MSPAAWRFEACRIALLSFVFVYAHLLATGAIAFAANFTMSDEFSNRPFVYFHLRCLDTGGSFVLRDNQPPNVRVTKSGEPIIDVNIRLVAP